MLMSFAGGGTGISPIPSAWAAPGCTDADEDGFFKYHPKGCPTGNDPDDSDPCIGTDGPIADCDGGSGGSGGSTAPDPYNLARASFATPAELEDPAGGVFADGVDSCAGYDYWDWQEALLPGGVGLTCATYLNRSNVSGGGRWFLISATGNEDPTDRVQRWLVVDFSDPVNPDSPCWNLDYLLDLPDPPQLASYNTVTGEYKDEIDYKPCVDNLAVRFSADRILKARANEQQLEFSIRWRPDPAASIYWPPWGYVSYQQPLYLRDPSENPEDPFYGRNCRVMSTRPAFDQPHDRDKAELLREIGPGTTELMGTYYLPLEVCVKRASD